MFDNAFKFLFCLSVVRKANIKSLYHRSNIKVIKLYLCHFLNTEQAFRNAQYSEKSSPLGMR